MAGNFAKASQSNITRKSMSFLSNYIENIPSKLQGYEGYNTFDKMMLNSTVASSIYMIMRACNSLDMFFYQAKTKTKKKKAKEIADFYNNLLIDMDDKSLSAFIPTALSFLIYGFSSFEMVAKKRDDGRIGIKKLAYRSIKDFVEWIADKQDNVIGMRQSGFSVYNKDYKKAIIPRDKLLVFTAPLSYDSLSGISPLAYIYYEWKHLECAMESETEWFYSNLNGSKILRVPSELMRKANDLSDPENKEAREALESYVKMAGELRVGQSFVMPSDRYTNTAGDPSSQAQYDVQTMSVYGQSPVNIHEVIERHQKNIYRFFNALRLIVGTTGKTGSGNLGETMEGLFVELTKSLMQIIVDEFNKSLVPFIAKLNGFDKNLLPTLKVKPIDALSAQQIANILNLYGNARGKDGEPFASEQLDRYVKDLTGFMDYLERNGLNEEDDKKHIVPTINDNKNV